jgi:hypothetical protein
MCDNEKIMKWKLSVICETAFIYTHPPGVGQDRLFSRVKIPVQIPPFDHEIVFGGEGGI